MDPSKVQLELVEKIATQGLLGVLLVAACYVIYSYHKENRQLQADLLRTRDTHATDVRALQATHDTQKSDLHGRYNTDLTRILTEHQRELADKNAQFQGKLEELNRGAQERLMTATSAFRDEIAAMTSDRISDAQQYNTQAMALVDRVHRTTDQMAAMIDHFVPPQGMSATQAPQAPLPPLPRPPARSRGGGG